MTINDLDTALDKSNVKPFDRLNAYVYYRKHSSDFDSLCLGEFYHTFDLKDALKGLMTAFKVKLVQVRVEHTFIDKADAVVITVNMEGNK